MKKKRKTDETGIRPCSDYVLIAPDPPPEAVEKVGSIFLPSRPAWERPTFGTVRAVGPGRLESGVRVGMQTKAGDRVFYPREVGTEIRQNGESLLLLREGLIHAIMEGV